MTRQIGRIRGPIVLFFHSDTLQSLWNDEENSPNLSKPPWRSFKRHCIQNLIIICNKNTKNISILYKTSFNIFNVNNFLLIGKL